jgi:hypothetical protein
MYARVTVLEWKKGHKREGMEQMIRLLHQTIVPAARQQQGFKGFLGLLNRYEGKGMAITMWQTEADLRACEASGYYQEQLAQAEPLLGPSALPLKREVYEVVIQE